MTKKIKNALVNSVIEGIQDKKGLGICVLDMKGIDSAICDYFIVCEGNSATHVDSIAESVEDKVREQLKDKPLHVEGRQNAIWVLLDYHDVIVHVFQKEARAFYSLETLWNDAKRTDVEDIQ